MRELGTLERLDEAQRLADFLLAQGIATKIDASPEGCTLWVRREDQVDAARQEFVAFRERPDDPKYVASSKAAQQIRNDEARREAEYRRRQHDVSRQWQARGGPTPLTMLLLFTSIGVALITGMETNSGPYALLGLVPYPTLERPFPTLADTWSSGQWWRFITPMLLHGGLIHLLFNMLWLYDLGRRVEGELGSFRFALMIVALSAAGNLAQYWATGPSVGMSGVVYGLFGFSWMQWRFGGRIAYAISSQTIFLMMAWFVLGWMSSGGAGLRIANMNHTAGLALGCLLGWLPFALRRWNR